MLKLWGSLAAKLVLKLYVQLRIQEELLTLLRHAKQACYQGLQDKHNSPGFGPTYSKYSGIAAIQKTERTRLEASPGNKGSYKMKS